MPASTGPESAARTGVEPSAYGSLLHLRRARRDPIGFLRRLAASGDIVGFDLAGQRAFLLSHPALIEEVLVTHASRFAKAPALDRASSLLGRGLLTADAALNTSRRRITVPAFHRERLNHYACVIVDATARQTATWRDGDTRDAVDEMTTLTLQAVGECLFSTDLSPVAAELRGILVAAVEALDPLVTLVAPMRHLRAARQRLDRIVGDLVERRLADPEPPDDLLTLLVQARGPDATREQLHDDTLTMLLAGHDTIGNALAWTWSWIASHPSVEAAFHAEVDTTLGGRSPSAADAKTLMYTRAVLAESLRLSPPAWLLARRALEDHRCGDTLLPAGSLVLMSPHLVHRDARFFDDPLAFAPERWLGSGNGWRPQQAFFPFGAGRRSCIGESFAWLEGILVLAAIGSRWRLVTATPDPDVEPRITMRPRGPLTVRIEARR
jgi:cytochrome P450